MAPVRPPIRETAWVAALDALPRALPAELVTLDRPCCALPAASEAPSLALVAVDEAAFVAASVVDDCARLWIVHLDCRRASRGRKMDDMVRERLRSESCVNG